MAHKKELIFNYFSKNCCKNKSTRGSQRERERVVVLVLVCVLRVRRKIVFEELIQSFRINERERLSDWWRLEKETERERERKIDVSKS